VARLLIFRRLWIGFMKTKLPRRTFLSGTALSVAALGTMGAQPFARAQDGKSPAVVTSGKTVTARDYLKSILYTKKR